MQKPFISTLINTTALTLTSYGVLQITTNNNSGYMAVLFGFGLEFMKYWGMKHKYW